MSKNILGLCALSLSMFGCAVQSADEAGVEKNTSAVTHGTVEEGASCGGSAGISNGRIDKYGWCCGTAPCSDPAKCGSDKVETCLNCNDETVNCGNGTLAGRGDGIGTKPGAVYDPGTKPETKPGVMWQQAGDLKKGDACHGSGTAGSGVDPVVFGTMDQYGFCCGVSKCNDKQTCGADYGKYYKACVNCKETAYIKCAPGPLIKVSAEDDGTGAPKSGAGGAEEGTGTTKSGAEGTGAKKSGARPPPCGCLTCC